MGVTEIPFGALDIRGVYVLRSRNLDKGVWTGEGFIGIREKFGDRYLDIEYPNTAVPLAKIEFNLDPRIQLRMRYEVGTCYWCGWPVDFDREREPRWQHITKGCGWEPRPTGHNYTPLFQALDSL